MTRHAVSPFDRSNEGRSHYRPRREKRREKKRSIGRSIRIVRKSASVPPWAHEPQVPSCLPFVSLRSRPLSIAFCNYSRVYDLVCAPRSVNRATRGPRPIECGTRWWYRRHTENFLIFLAYFSPTFYHNFLLLQFFTLAFILASYIIANLFELSFFLSGPVARDLSTSSLYISFIYLKKI